MLKTAAQSSTTNRANGSGWERWISVHGDLQGSGSSLFSVCVFGNQEHSPGSCRGWARTSSCSSSGIFTDRNLPQLRDIWDSFCALCNVREKLPFMGLEGIGDGGVLLGFLSLSGTINLFYPIVFTGLSPEFDPSSVILQ